MTRRQRGEGSVSYDEQRGLWVGRLDLGRVSVNGKSVRKRRAVYAKTQKGCIAKLREVRKAADAGVLTTRSMTVEKWLEHWVDDIAPRRVKPKTLATYRTYVHRYLVPAVGRVRLDKLTTAHVRDVHAYVLSLRKTSTTAGHAHRILGTALADAMRDDLVTRNVAAIESAPRNREAQRRPLTLDEVRRFAHVVDGDRLASRWVFGFLTGARQGEVLGLRWADVNLDAGVVNLATQLQRIPYRHGCGKRTTEGWPCGRKRADRCPLAELDVPPGFWFERLDGNLCMQRPKTSGSTRVVPLPAPLIGVLRQRHALYLAERDTYGTDHGLVWCRPDGRPIDGSDDREAWGAYLRAAGIPATDQHSMRHTATTLLLMLGVEEHVRMSILGHSEEATNRLYSHVDLTLQRDAMERLGAAFLAEVEGQRHGVERIVDAAPE